jgi:hypothetical protein
LLSGLTNLGEWKYGIAENESKLKIGNGQEGSSMQENMSSTDAFAGGQRVAFATTSLVLGIASCIHMLGLEKAIPAIIFGWLALKGNGGVKLGSRRMWATVGIVLGALYTVIVPAVIIAFWPKVKILIEALEKLS